jgi:acetolactate synthase-1/2/3 large subunit
VSRAKLAPRTLARSRAHIQRERYGNQAIASDLTNPDFPGLAASFSLFSQRATTPADLHTALTRALPRNEPALIEVPLGELPGP